MLNPKGNRLDYGELLSPPSGFELTKAVGTTYSLDLYALLALPVAMFYQKSLDGDFKQNRYDILDAIHRSKERIDLFYQRAKSKPPKSYNSLLAFIDDCGIEVIPPTYASSFHPKLWCLRFEKKEEVVYRLIIMSRNLTFDRSWDVSCYMDGHVSGTRSADNEKLSKYLKFFYRQANRPFSEQFFADLNTVNFEVPSGFGSKGIHPIQYFDPSNSELTNPLASLDWDKLLVVSPFVDKTTIDNFKRRSKEIHLFSRKEELDRIDASVLSGIDCYQFNPIIVDGEHTLDAETLISASQNLHAKLYIGLKDHRTTWMLGSANFTSPAFERNTEIMISLVSDSSGSSFNRMKSELISDSYKLFEPYERTLLDKDETEEKLQQQLREFLFKLSQVVISGTVVPRPTQVNYDMVLEADLSSVQSNDFQVFTRAIHLSGNELELQTGKHNDWKIENVPLTKLSPYVVVRIVHPKATVETLLKIEVTLPVERTDAIFHDLINNKKRFHEFLRFLLAPDELKGDLEIPTDDIMESSKLGYNGHVGLGGFESPIYEHLLVAASRNPSKLKDIDKIVERLKRRDPEIVADFESIWDVFKSFADE